MKPFKDLKPLNTDTFKRETGLSKENVTWLIKKVDTYINAQKERFPEKKRGRNKTIIPLEDRILLTLYYLRHYPTFSHLGGVFGISASYCCKIYHEHVQIFAQIARPPSRKTLLHNPQEKRIIDTPRHPTGQ